MREEVVGALLLYRLLNYTADSMRVFLKPSLPGHAETRGKVSYILQHCMLVVLHLGSEKNGSE